jgi:hypothetical protein
LKVIVKCVGTHRAKGKGEKLSAGLFDQCSGPTRVFDIELEPPLPEAMKDFYPLASISAEKETGLSLFPPTYPYTFTEILST